MDFPLYRFLWLGILAIIAAVLFFATGCGGEETPYTPEVREGPVPEDCILTGIKVDPEYVEVKPGGTVQFRAILLTSCGPYLAPPKLTPAL